MYRLETNKFHVTDDDTLLEITESSNIKTPTLVNLKILTAKL